MELTSTELRKLNGAARVPSISTSERLCPKLRSSSTCAPKASLPCDPCRTPPDSCGSLVEKSSIVSADCRRICCSLVDATGLLAVRPGTAMRVPVTTISFAGAAVSAAASGVAASCGAGAACAVACVGICTNATASAASATAFPCDLSIECPLAPNDRSGRSRESRFAAVHELFLTAPPRKCKQPVLYWYAIPSPNLPRGTPMVCIAA